MWLPTWPQTFTANADGTYTLKNLAPGRYEITVSASGYSAAITTVSLSVNSSSSANLVLQLVPPGAEAKTSSSSAVSGVVDSNSVSNLPLNGRSASDLAALEPGVERAYAADSTSTARLREPNDDIRGPASPERCSLGRHQRQ